MVGRSPPPCKREGEAGRSLISPGAAEGSLLLQASAPPCSPAHKARPGPGNVSWCAVCSIKVSPAVWRKAGNVKGSLDRIQDDPLSPQQEGPCAHRVRGRASSSRSPGAPDSRPLPLPFPFWPVLGSSAVAAYFKTSPGYLRKLEGKDGGDPLHTHTHSFSRVGAAEGKPL